MIENIYAGSMSWLALGCPVHVQSSGPRTTGVFMRRTSSLALDLFMKEWNYVCRRAADTQFSGGRADLAGRFRSDQPADVAAYGGHIQSRSWWKNHLPGVSSWRTAAWALPLETSGRGAFKHFEGDRISLPVKSVHLPSADLVRDMRPDLAAALDNPNGNVLPLDERGPMPHVSHVTNHKEALRYFKRKSDADMLKVHRLSSIPKGPDGKPLSSGLVAVSKGVNAPADRGVSDRRLANWGERDLPCPKLAHGCLLTRLSSDRGKGETWRFSLSDLPDCFHNLSAKGEHEIYNAEGVPFRAKVLRGAQIPVDDDILDAEWCMCCCTTIVMGDKKAVAIAQTAHLQMLKDGHCDVSLLEYGIPVSSEDVVGGVIVDDFAVFAKQKGVSVEELKKGIHGYQKHGIGPKADKLKFDVDHGVVWGTNFDGANNKVSASIDKIVELILISLAALQHGSMSPLGMQILTGGWGFCLMFRRSMFCLLHRVYDFARLPDCNLFRSLDAGSRSELFITALVGPMMCSHLDWPYGNKLYAHDACGTGGCAFGSAEVTPDFLQELWRFVGVKEVATADQAMNAGHAWPVVSPPVITEPLIFPDRFKAEYVRLPLKPFRVVSAKIIMTLNLLVSAGQGLFLELWGGTGGLSRAMTAAGAEIFGAVDICHFEKENLLDLGFVELLLRVVSRGYFNLIHMGIVCTTFSIAAKPPYRFRDQDGFTQTRPDLPDYKKDKVAAGDWFLHLGLVVFELQLKGGRFATVENPGTSMLWCERALLKLVDDWSLLFVAFDMCQYGALYKKYTKVLTNLPALMNLSRRCPGNHVHEVLAGSVFDPKSGKWQSRTKLAAEYPVSFNKKYASLATEALDFAPKGVVSSHFDDALRITDLCHICNDQSISGVLNPLPSDQGVTVQVNAEGDPLAGSVSGVEEMIPRPGGAEVKPPELGLQSSGLLPEGPEGSGSKSHVNPWEEILEEIVVGLRWRPGRAWTDHSNSHINILEVKAWAGLMRKLASSPANFQRRIISVWDSKVGRAATAKGRSSAFRLLAQYRSVLPSLLGAGLEYGGFWVPSESMPMDGPSRGRRCPEPLPGNFSLPSKSSPLIDLATLNVWKCGLWVPWNLTVAQRRDARYGYRGVRVGNARVPGPMGSGLIRKVFVFGFLLVECRVSCLPGNSHLPIFKPVSFLCSFSFVMIDLGTAPRPRRVRVDRRPLTETVVDMAFQRRLDSARRTLQQFLSSTNGMLSWEALGNCDHRSANQALLHWVQYAFENDLTYNQAVEGVLSFSHEHYWVSLRPTWRLLRAWRNREPVEVRHPIHLPLLKACVVIALSWGWEHFSMLLWLGYHALLRPGELSVLTPFDFVFHDRLLGGLWQTVCIVRICRPKTRRLGPRRQHVVITESVLVKWIYAIVTPLKQSRNHATLTSYSLATLNKRFSQCLQALGIPLHVFTLAGLRAGGATWEYLNDAAIANLKFRGRWAAESSLEHYIQECVAFLDFEQLNDESRRKILSLSSMFHVLVPTFVNCKECVAHPTLPPCEHAYQYHDKNTGTGTVS